MRWTNIPRAMHLTVGAAPTLFVWFLALFLLISAGITYRVLATRLSVFVETPVALPVSLDTFPERVGQWVGEDVPIPVNIQEVAGNDAFLNRSYRNRLSDQWANVYIAYTARPRTMMGHRPRVCYPGGGWIHDGTQQAQVTSDVGREFPCLIHRFHRPAPDNEETVVLNFYIVNGRLTSDDRNFSGVLWRTPNIDGDPARYVAQVQISMFENSIRAVAKEIVEPILDFFPDENGKVRAIEYVESSRGVPR
ncbi:MAG: exosortase-associated EpsI family protein [Planctomycetota bacterium]